MQKAVFIPIRETPSKLKAIQKISHTHFINKERLLFIVPDKSAAEFLDNLLWHSPEESFLPHSIIEKPSNDPIAITTSPTNLNHANIIFNLTQTALTSLNHCRLIYEFEDFTSPDKQSLSQKRFRSYREAGFAISSQELILG